MISSQGQPGKRGREDDDDERPHKKRKGNNPFGAKGLLKCELCRKQKQKCKFPENEPDRPCVLCSRNFHPCGPKVSTRTHQWSPTATRNSREIQSSSRLSVDNPGAVQNSFDPNRIQTPPGWLGTQPRLSQIAASIENQYPNATLEEHYRMTGDRLLPLQSSQNASTQTPQTQFMTTIRVQSSRRDQGSGGSESKLSRTPHDDTIESFPSSVNVTGGTQQPQQRAQSHLNYQTHFQGSLQPVSGSTFEPLFPFSFSGSHSGERASTPTSSEDKIFDGDVVSMAVDAPSTRTPRLGIPGPLFSSPAGSHGEREIRSSQIDPLPNPLPSTQAPYPPSSLFQGRRQTQRHGRYQPIQQGPSYSDVDPFRRPRPQFSRYPEMHDSSPQSNLSHNLRVETPGSTIGPSDGGSGHQSQLQGPVRPDSQVQTSHAVVTGPSESDGKFYSATLKFQRPQKSSLTAESVAFIRLKSDCAPFDFVRMDHVGEIVGDQWGPVGMVVLEAATKLLSHDVSNDGESATRFSVQSSKAEGLQLRSLPAGVSVEGYATPMEWKALLSCLKWLFSSLSHDQPSALRIRRFVPSTATVTESQFTSSEFVIQEEIISPHHIANDSMCWLSLIDGANIGLYDDIPPVSSSSHDWVGKGLKIPFHILVHIAGIDEIVDVDGTPVLCGFRTALIPIESFDDGSVQWHFLTGGSEERFRWFSDRHDFLQSLPAQRLRHVDINDLKGTAYVGGWSSVRTILGTNDPPNPILRSRLPQTKYQFIRSGIDIEGAIQVVPGIGFAPFLGITQKLEFMGMRCVHTPEQELGGMVDDLYTKQVILYDDSEKTGYLCQLINLITSLVRAYLRDNRYEYNTNLLNFGTGVENNQVNVRTLLVDQTDRSVNSAFKIITKRYSEKNSTLRKRVHSSKSEIFGFELADILDGSDSYARKLSVGNGVEAWNALAELTDVVFCGGYGDVMLSSDGAQCCLKPPTGWNVLICPLILLKKHFDDVEGNCFRQRGREQKGREKLVWVFTGTPFECSVRKRGKSCDGLECWAQRLQFINPHAKLVKNRHKNQHNIESVVFDEADGAIGFGKIQNIRTRSSSRAVATISRRQSPNFNHTTPRQSRSTAHTPNPLGEQDIEIEVVDTMPPSQPTVGGGDPPTMTPTSSSNPEQRSGHVTGDGGSNGAVF